MALGNTLVCKVSQDLYNKEKIKIAIALPTVKINRNKEKARYKIDTALPSKFHKVCLQKKWAEQIHQGGMESGGKDSTKQTHGLLFRA